MTILHKCLLTIFVILWLGLSYILIDRAGFTLYNLLVALITGGLIVIPLVKKWRNPNA